MNQVTNFTDVVKAILYRHAQTSLRERWEEAIASGLKPIAFWVRESSDLVNIAWMNKSGIWDITWYPKSNTSAFAFARLSTITGFESRAGADAVKQSGLVVSGIYTVEVFAGTSRGGGFIWAATSEEESGLRDFVSKLAELLLEV